ncbi:unnamed protein product [Blepharisma stoltei]|uniref:U-box domain-containing protein n=1 Tax=Blepharisma stoltei TaxID=1481888 RepID=A0AAU9K7Y7_9CILI|nr:unnamed protein product [Blepharisma stoltei]
MVENFVDVPDDYCCPITGDLMEDPVVAPDGHSYERASITAWFQKNKTSPLTGAALKNTVLIDNHRLKAIISSFKEKMPEIQRECQIKRDLIEAINIREAFFEDSLKKGNEQIGNITSLYNNEKEKNLMLENKLISYKKSIEIKINHIEWLKTNLDHFQSLSFEKDNEIKRLNMELATSLHENSELKRFIKANNGNFVNKLLRIQQCLKQYEKDITSNKLNANNQLAGIRASISDLISENSKFEFEDLKKPNLLIENQQNPPQDAKNSDENLQLLLENKIFNIWNIPNNSKIEEDFREPVTKYAYTTNPAVSLAFQRYIDAYHQKTSLYLIDRDKYDRNRLIVYDTENEREKAQNFEAPEILTDGTCIAQLPDGELFCFGNNPASGISLVIDGNNRVRILPSGIPCKGSSAIYFNRNIYCFGGSNTILLTLSDKFSLDENQWIYLNPLPIADCKCHCAVFNGNILISGCWNPNILRYSIENDDFSRIPFDFAEYKRKILINTERLYLIECDNGSVYESEIGNENVWKKVGKSIISDQYPSQVYWSYNKGAIYIATSLKNERYYKFNLQEKLMIKFL